jgi:flavin reductase (DIM6/NTAB) family NADH-FMN oxidoreductase RutF
MTRGEGARALRAGSSHDRPADLRVHAGIDGESFRSAMRDLAGAVAIVTARLGERRTGCTVSSLQCYAVAPPILLVSLGRESSSAKLIAEAGRFGVSLLGSSLRDVASGFSRPTVASGEERFRHGRWTTLVPDGQWLAEGAIAGFECTVDELIPRHSHVIVLGKVVAMMRAGAAEQPLLYWRQGYRELV